MDHNSKAAHDAEDEIALLRETCASHEGEIARLRGALSLIRTSYQWKPNSDGAILEQCVEVACAALSEE